MGPQHPKLVEARLGVALTDVNVTATDADLALYRSWGLAHPLMLELVDEHTP